MKVLKNLEMFIVNTFDMIGNLNNISSAPELALIIFVFLSSIILLYLLNPIGAVKEYIQENKTDKQIYESLMMLSDRGVQIKSRDNHVRVCINKMPFTKIDNVLTMVSDDETRVDNNIEYLGEAYDEESSSVNDLGV